MSKFREFWIKPAYKPEDEDRISFCKVPKNDFEHVIEYAALAAKDAEIDKLKKQLEVCRVALLEASEWHQKDDVNGEAGYIAWKALKELEKMK